MSLKRILLTLLSVPTLLCAITFESDRFRDILPYVEEGTVVVTDMDYTVFMPMQDVGREGWFKYQRDGLVKKGLSIDEIEAIELPLAQFIMRLVEMELVDPEAGNVLRQLQDQGTIVIGLTAREPALTDLSHLHLKAVNVSFSVHHEDFILHDLEHPIAYSRGVILCSEKNKKSKSLLTFFKKFGLSPKRVIFLDDKWKHVRDLEAGLEAAGIEYVGVRFSGGDKSLSNFDLDIAKIQFSHLPHLLTDDEARKLKKH